ncbi:MAG: hypothetical protein LBL46_00890, partial [Rickettsiales bacterium]|nr:hypothetical protein [Rickettsiales bacterium]
KGNAVCARGATSTEATPTAASGEYGHWCRISGRKTWVCAESNGNDTGNGHICGILFSAYQFNANLFNTLTNAN